MPINNVINTNKISEILKGTTVRRTRAAQSPAYLSKFGSIFNAPGVKQPAQPQFTERANIAELNAKQSLKDLEDKKPSKEKSSVEEKFGDINSVSDGKKAVSEGNSIKGTTQKLTKQTQGDTKIVQQFSTGAQKLEKQIVKDDKKFASTFKTEQNELKKNNQKLDKLNKEQENIQKEVNNAQHELDSLLASNSFSGSSGAGGVSNKSGRISELQHFIGAKVGLMQNNGKVVYSLQRNQTRTLGRLNRTNAQYIKINNMNRKNMQAEEVKTNKVIDVANKVEQYSVMAQSAGQAINIAGMALVALGGATSSFFGAGGALIAIGKVMQKVGKVVELVGQYGQTAAGLTKTGAYAAEGNIMGAMASAASAMQSGAAAVAGTKNIKTEFQAINAKAEATKQTGQAKFEAKKEFKTEYGDKSKEEIKAAGGKKKIIADKVAEKTKDIKQNPVDWGAELTKLGNSATNIAGVFMQNNAIEQMSRRPNKNLQPFQMDARMQRIMERNQRYRRHAAAYV